MTTNASFLGGRGRPDETAEEKAARLEREQGLLDAGREDIRAGRSVSGAELDARLQAFARGELRQRHRRTAK